MNSQRGEITGVMWISFGYGGPGISRWVTRGGEGVRGEAHGRKRASEGDEPGRGEGEGEGRGGVSAVGAARHSRGLTELQREVFRL